MSIINKNSHYGPRTVNDGLVLCLDAGNPTSYPGSDPSGNTWTDLSGNGNNATLINTPTYNTANLGSLSFNGTNEYMELNSPLDLEISFGSGFTMCLFLQQSIPQISIGWNYFHAKGTIEIGAFTSSENISSLNEFGFKDNSLPITVLSGNVATSWSYIAFGTTTTKTPFLHRFNSSGYDLDTNETAFTNHTLTFQRMFRSAGLAGDRYYRAKVATIQAYNRALSTAEVTQNYHALRGRFGLP